MHRCPLDKWVLAAFAGAVTLQAFPAAASDAPLAHPRVVVASPQSRPATGARASLLSLVPYSAPVIAGRRLAAFGSSADEWPAYPASPFAVPANPLEERFQAVPRSSKALASFPVGTGRFSLVWLHGANMGAYLRFDDSIARPTVELTERGARKITFAVSLHW